MSIERITGNLLDFPGGCTVIAHQVNRQQRYGSGLAKAIKEELPAAYEAYMAAFTVEADGTVIAPPLGSLVPAEVGSGRRVVNCFAQDAYGRDQRHTDYEALYACLEQLEKLLAAAQSEGRPWTLGLPHGLGCGSGGGAWPVVNEMIEHVFRQSPVHCVIVQRVVKPAAQPVPPLTLSP